VKGQVNTGRYKFRVGSKKSFAKKIIDQENIGGMVPPHERDFSIQKDE